MVRMSIDGATRLSFRSWIKLFGMPSTVSLRRQVA